jgi:hypothetical protein
VISVYHHVADRELHRQSRSDAESSDRGAGVEAARSLRSAVAARFFSSLRSRRSRSVRSRAAFA